MLPLLADVIFILVALSTAWFVARRLLVEATLMLLAVVFASLIAIVSFEPAAHWCTGALFAKGDLYLTQYLWAFLALSIFAYSAIMLFHVFSRILMDPPLFGGRVESVGRVAVGCLSGYLVAAFLLTVVQTLPGSRDYWGLLEPDAAHRSSPIMAFAPDYQFLTLVEYVCVPHSAISGTPWALGGPAVKPPQLAMGRWQSFPIRYAIWREQLASALANEDPDSPNATYEDAYPAEYFGDDSAEGTLQSDEVMESIDEGDENSDEYRDY